MEHLPNPSPMDFATRLHWARTHLRKINSHRLAAICKISENDIEALEANESFIHDNALTNILNIALALDVFFPWLLDGLGHPYNNNINQHIEWIRAIDPHWRAPQNPQDIPLIDPPKPNPDVLSLKHKNNALAPASHPNTQIITKRNLPVLTDHWVMFHLPPPYWNCEGIPRFMRAAQDQKGQETLWLNPQDTPIMDLLPSNPLHLAYRIPFSLLRFYGPIIAQVPVTEKRQKPRERYNLNGLSNRC